MKSKVVGLALIAGAFLALAAPAQAGRWSYGNGPTDIWTVHPGSGGSFDVCTTQVHGRVGLHGFGDPDGPPPTPPPPPYAPVTVNVYAGPAGYLNGAVAVTGGLHPLSEPTGFVLPPVASMMTGAPTALNPQEQYGPDVWVYAAAPFSVQMPAGAVSAGDDVVIQKDGYGAVSSQTSFEKAIAIDCDQPTWRKFLWNVASTGDGTVTQSSTGLSMRLGSGPKDDPSSTYFTDCVVVGDFDARVHYKLTSWPPLSSVHAGLLVNNPAYPDTAGSLSMERTSSVSDGESYVLDATDPGGGLLTLPTTATSGDLRVEQEAGTITARYRDASTSNKWKKLDTSPAYTAPVSIGLSAWAMPTRSRAPSR